MRSSKVKKPGWYRWVSKLGGEPEIVQIVDRGGDLFVYASRGEAQTKWLSTHTGDFIGPIDLNARLPLLGKEAEIRKDFETMTAHAEDSALEAAERVATQWAEGVINRAEFRAGMREAFGLTPSGPGTLLIGSNCGVPSDG